MQNPFVWAGNQPVDQNQLATRRALANALINKSLDTSPVQHWTQALARVAQGIAGMRQGQFADEDEGKAKAELGSVRNAMLGGEAAPAATQGGLVNVTPPPPQNPLMKAGNAKGYDNPASRALYDAAIAKGYSPVQAAAFVGAGALPESTLNPNARNPGDGRDGSDSIGMFQWNSSRAKALQEFAASKGKPWNDPNVQAEFALAELEGPEAKAGQMLRGAKTPEEATAAMLAYLRPGGYKPGAPQGVPSYGARLRNTAGVMSAFSGGMAQPQQPLSGVQPMQEQPPVQVAQAPQAAPAGQAPQTPSAPAGGISQERLKAAYTILNSPFAGPGDKAVAQTIIQKALTAETRDPRDSALKDVQLESGRLGLEKTRRELGSTEMEMMQAPDGTVFEREKGKPGAQWRESLKLPQKPKEPNVEIIRDAATGEIIAVDKSNIDAGVKKLREGGPSKDAPTTRQIKQPDGSEVVVQWNPESRTWEPMKAPEGGNAVRAPAKLTEQQSKDLVYYNRGIQALESLGDGKALTELSGATIGQVPVAGNYAKSDQYRQQEQAGRNFLVTILRKDTGAAVTKPEEQIYGDMFLPRPGDDEGTLRLKTEARRQAIDGIRDGLGPAEILALGQRLTRKEDAKVPKPDEPKKRAPSADPLGLFQ